MNLIERMRLEPVVGIFSKTTDSSFVEAAGLAGLDFIILDMEHGPIGLESLGNHVRAAQLTQMQAIVRVSGVNSNAIGAALDTGATGVQVPNINTAAQAEEAVAAARFYPNGSRGVCRFVRAAGFGNQDKTDYFRAAADVIVVLQVEGVEGVRNIDAILDVPHFDVLFVGPYDLSQSVGKPGEVDAPEVVDLMRLIAQKASARGVLLGTFCDTPKNASTFEKEGFRYLAYSVDINIFSDACKKVKALVK